MTGEEHYKTAETLLTNSQAFIAGDVAAGRLHTPERRAEIIAMAQGHATLAHAAATTVLAKVTQEASE